MRNTDALHRLARMFRIVTLLGSCKPNERIGCRHLAEECQCSTKTIERDLHFLDQAGIHWDYDASARTYRLEKNCWNLPVVALTPTDVLALALARSWFAAEANALPFAAETTAALDKAGPALTPSQSALFTSACRLVAQVGGLARDYSNAPVGLLLQACVEQRTVNCVYESRSGGAPGRRERLLDPYRLDRRDGQFLELQAFCHERQAVRTFAVDRIANARITNDRFMHRDWTPDDLGVIGGLRGGPLIEVDVLFDETVSAYAREHDWNFEAKFDEDAGLRMRGQVKGTAGISKELLRWGRHVRVLGGPELLAAIRSEVHAMADLYKN